MKKLNHALLLILGNQLFEPKIIESLSPAAIVLIEDYGLCTYERHHQQKIVLFLAAVRAYAEELKTAGFTVIYHHLETMTSGEAHANKSIGRSRQVELSFEQKLQNSLVKAKCDSLVYFEIEDKAMELRVRQFTVARKLDTTELSSPMFLSSREHFKSFCEGRKNLRMAEYYKGERQRLNILIDEQCQPHGGRWSFDQNNRKKLPKTVEPPPISIAENAAFVSDVITLVEQRFSNHPGDASQFWWPTTRTQARQWLEEFLVERLEKFGPYEDAISQRTNTLFHSALSPMINMGLLTPKEVINTVLRYARDHDLPIQSIEGFVRQVIGWREFVRGVYQNYSDQQEASNYWSHSRDLTEHWYSGTTGIPPLDDTIKAALKLGWTHHIPRLMIAGNLMTLCEIEPKIVHRWFMEMYVDSSEWVMGPNVYGMGIFSDGGVFATKPYICGSNYLLKISDYSKGPWCEVVDGLYWRFIDKHQSKFAANPRLALMTRALTRLESERKDKIFAAAEKFLAEKTA